MSDNKECIKSSIESEIRVLKIERSYAIENHKKNLKRINDKIKFAEEWLKTRT